MQESPEIGKISGSYSRFVRWGFGFLVWVFFSPLDWMKIDH